MNYIEEMKAIYGGYFMNPNFIMACAHLFAFDDKGIERKIPVPKDEWFREMSDEDRLEMLFKYGQNDFAPVRMRSISVGDVIELDAKGDEDGPTWYKVAPCGFVKVEQDEHRALWRIKTADRRAEYRARLNKRLQEAGQ